MKNVRSRFSLGRWQKAQGLVEFALILPVLLILFMGIVEFGRMLQTWLTIQNCAQAGARYAATGQHHVNPISDPWDQARLQAIKDEARRLASSLSIDDTASPVQPGYFAVSVHSVDLPEPTPGAEFPGGPNAMVSVDIQYNHALITPIVQTIVPWIKLSSHSEVVNERYRHPGFGTPPGSMPSTIEPTPVRYYIAGYLRLPDGSPISGVVLNGLPDNPTTGATGYYIVQVDTGWSGVVTPVLASYRFDPVSRNYTSLDADMPAEDYTGTIIYDVGGYVRTGGGFPIAGVVLTGLPGDPTTDANGHYTVEVDAGWSGVVTPVLEPYHFDPITRNYTSVNADMPAEDYTGTERYDIAGYVLTGGGSPLPGVVLSGLPGNPATDANGYYSVEVDGGWSGVVTPLLGGYDFSPNARTYTSVGADMPAEDYTGTNS